MVEPVKSLRWTGGGLGTGGTSELLSPIGGLNLAGKSELPLPFKPIEDDLLTRDESGSHMP